MSMISVMWLLCCSFTLHKNTTTVSCDENRK